jgi:hypothetical protein
VDAGFRTTRRPRGGEGSRKNIPIGNSAGSCLPKRARMAQIRRYERRDVREPQRVGSIARPRGGGRPGRLAGPVRPRPPAAAADGRVAHGPRAWTAGSRGASIPPT